MSADFNGTLTGLEEAREHAEWRDRETEREREKEITMTHLPRTTLTLSEQEEENRACSQSYLLVKDKNYLC